MTPKQAETMREVSRIIMYKAAEFMNAFRLLDELILCAEIKYYLAPCKGQGRSCKIKLV